MTCISLFNFHAKIRPNSDKLNFEKYKRSSNPVTIETFIDQIEHYLEEAGAFKDFIKLQFIRIRLNDEANVWGRCFLDFFLLVVFNQIQTIERVKSVKEYVNKFRRLVGMLFFKYQDEASIRDSHKVRRRVILQKSYWQPANFSK